MLIRELFRCWFVDCTTLRQTHLILGKKAIKCISQNIKTIMKYRESLHD